MKFNFFNFNKTERPNNKMDLANELIDTMFSINEEELEKRIEENKAFFDKK